MTTDISLFFKRKVVTSANNNTIFVLLAPPATRAPLAGCDYRRLMRQENYMHNQPEALLRSSYLSQTARGESAALARNGIWSRP
ncbi:hypothetical protein LJC46_09640 [Desulfovibrio sp. OttesenSCG-928-G15]|nr:hypothetical protein [Desulfovibrio sp. OttesenSCG-928-G15]